MHTHTHIHTTYTYTCTHTRTHTHTQHTHAHAHPYTHTYHMPTHTSLVQVYSITLGSVSVGLHSHWHRVRDPSRPCLHSHLHHCCNPPWGPSWLPPCEPQDCHRSVPGTVEYHDLTGRVHPHILAATPDQDWTRNLVGCVCVCVCVCCFALCVRSHTHCVSFTFSEAVCTPFASSIISDYFDEVNTQTSKQSRERESVRIQDLHTCSLFVSSPDPPNCWSGDKTNSLCAAPLLWAQWVSGRSTREGLGYESLHC